MPDSRGGDGVGKWGGDILSFTSVLGYAPSSRSGYLPRERSLHRTSPRAGASFVLSQNKAALKPAESTHFSSLSSATSSSREPSPCYLSGWHGHQFGLGQGTVSPGDYPDMLSAMGFHFGSQCF